MQLWNFQQPQQIPLLNNLTQSMSIIWNEVQLSRKKFINYSQANLLKETLNTDFKSDFRKRKIVKF